MTTTTDQIWDNIEGEDDGTGREPLKPLWTINFSDDQKILQWFRDSLPILEDGVKQESETWEHNLGMYKGEHWPREAPLPRDQVRSAPGRQRKITVNHIYELTEQWVSKMTRFKPAVAVLPSNNEYNDRQAAKIAKMVVDYLAYINDVDGVLERMARHCRIFGESYVLVGWDPSAGPDHPDYAKAKKDGKKVKLPASKFEDGEAVEVDRPIRVGEVSFKVLLPTQVYPEPENCWENVDYCVIRERCNREDVIAAYPDKNIEWASEGQERERFEDKHGKVWVYEIYHRSTDFLDKGRYIKLTGRTVLENIEHPYSHKELPLVRLTDIDVPGQLHGRSFFQNVDQLNLLYDKVYTLMWRATAAGAHLKWMMPKGACNVVSLGNTASVVEYAGPVPPRLEMPRVINSDLFQFAETIRTESEKISGIHGVSRGEPPPGIRAGIALQFLEEQENQRANSAVIKHNATIRNIWRMALSIAGDYYDESDGRTIRIIGRNNQFIIKALDNTKLSSPFDIRVQNTSALPESKAGRIQSLIDLRETFGPELVPDAQVADMLELGQPEKFYDWATAAIQKAESENEDMLEDMTIPEPEEYEEHISHWTTHMKAMQARSFAQVPEGVYKKFEDHLIATEMLMDEKQMQNQLFAEKLQMLDGWPAFYKQAPPPPPEAPMNGAGAGPNGLAPAGLPPDMMEQMGMAPGPLPEGAAPPGGDGVPPPGPAIMPPKLPVPER